MVTYIWLIFEIGVCIKFEKKSVKDINRNYAHLLLYLKANQKSRRNGPVNNYSVMKQFVI